MATRSPIPSDAISSNMPVFMAAKAMTGGPRLTDHDHRRAVAEQALVGRDADPGAVALAAEGVAPQLPHQLAHLGDGLSRHRLPAASQSAPRGDRGVVAD